MSLLTQLYYPTQQVTVNNYLVRCPSPDIPNNGMMNCLMGADHLLSYEDTCSFTCNNGYELTGSDTRTCQSNGSWNGSDSECRRGNNLM